MAKQRGQGKAGQEKVSKKSVEDLELKTGLDELDGDGVVPPGEDPFPAQPAEESEEKSKEERYVLHQIPIDKFSTKRVRVRLTPAVCTHCGTDICAVNNLGRYEDLSEEVQGRVKRALEAHKEAYHTKAEAKVVRASELPKANVGVAIVGAKGATK